MLHLKRRIALWVITAATGAAACATQNQVLHLLPAVAKGTLTVPYRSATTPSGIQLATYEISSSPDETVTVSYLAGAADEPKGKEGIAHLAEHLTYLARHRGQELTLRDRLIRIAAISQGSTHFDSTDFSDTARPESLNALLAMEADRMQEPLAGITEADVSAERDRAVAEIVEWNRSASIRGLSRLFELAFPGGPYGRHPWGTPQSLANVSLAELVEWCRSHYQPSGAMVVIQGNVKAVAAARAFFEVFEPLLPSPGGATKPLVLTTPPIQWPSEPAPLVVERAPVELPELFVAWAVPGRGGGEEFNARWAASFIEKRLASEFLDDWRVEDLSTLVSGLLGGRGLTSGRVADSIRVDAPMWEGAGLVVVVLRLKRESDAPYVYGLIREMVDKPIWPPASFKATDYRQATQFVALSEYFDRLDGTDVARLLRADPERYNLVRYLDLVGRRAEVTGLQAYAEKYLSSHAARGLLLAPDPAIGVFPERHVRWPEGTEYLVDSQLPGRTLLPAPDSPASFMIDQAPSDTFTDAARSPGGLPSIRTYTMNESEVSLIPDLPWSPIQAHFADDQLPGGAEIRRSRLHDDPWVEEMAYVVDGEIPAGACSTRSNVSVGPDEEFVVSNGARIEVFRRAAAPLVSVRVLVNAPAAAAPVPTLAFEQIHGRRRYAPLIGGRAEQLFDADHFVFGEDVLSGNVENALADNWEFLEDRRYYSKQFFAELKAWNLRRLEDRRSIPSRNAAELLDSRLFPGHAYGLRPDANEYRDISVADVSAWTEDALRPEATTLVVAGDVTPNTEFNEQVERRFGGWTRWGNRAKRADWPAAPLPLARTLDVVQRSGPVATVLVGVRLRAVETRLSPSMDALAWQLERDLDRAFREATGISHSVDVTRRDRPLGSSLMVQVTLDGARSDWAVRTILDALQAKSRTPMSPGAAERARLEVLREFPARFDTLEHLTRRAVDAVATYHDPLHWEGYQKAIAEVTAETILAAAQQLATGSEAVVVVGDKGSVSALP